MRPTAYRYNAAQSLGERLCGFPNLSSYAVSDAGRRAAGRSAAIFKMADMSGIEPTYPGQRPAPAATRLDHNGALGFWLRRLGTTTATRPSARPISRDRLRLCRRLDYHAIRAPFTVCTRWRRHQLELGAKLAAAGATLPGRRLCHHAFRAGLSVRRARLRQSLVHHQPHRGRRPSHRKFDGQAMRRAARPATATPCRSPATLSASRPMRRCRCRTSTRPATAKPISPAAASGLPTMR